MLCLRSSLLCLRSQIRNNKNVLSKLSRSFSSSDNNTVVSQVDNIGSYTPSPSSPVGGILASSIATYPFKDAIRTFQGETEYDRLSYASIEILSNDIAAGFIDMGLEIQDSVGFSLSPYTAENIITTLAIAKAGLRLIPVTSLADVNPDVMKALVYDPTYVLKETDEMKNTEWAKEASFHETYTLPEKMKFIMISTAKYPLMGGVSWRGIQVNGLCDNIWENRMDNVSRTKSEELFLTPGVTQADVLKKLNTSLSPADSVCLKARSDKVLPFGELSALASSSQLVLPKNLKNVNNAIEIESTTKYVIEDEKLVSL